MIVGIIEGQAVESGSAIEVCQPFIGYKYDSAFALLIKNLVPRGWRGFILAALLGAVMSSLASMLNSASTIFTMDVYKKFFVKDASQKSLVMVGRICVGVFAVIGCLVAPQLDNPKFGGVFKFIQEFQGYISPGILAVFVFGLLNRKAPSITGVVGLILCPILYFAIKMVTPELAFLDRMAITFFGVIAVMWIITLIAPRKEPFVIVQNTEMALESSGIAKVFGAIVVAITIALYIYFR
jgi:SSS family solute:Na+ symporter